MPRTGFFLLYQLAQKGDPIIVVAQSEIEAARMIGFSICSELHCPAHTTDMRHSHIRADCFQRGVTPYSRDDPKLAGLSFREFPIMGGRARIIEHLASPRRRKGLTVYYRRGTVLDQTDAP